MRSLTRPVVFAFAQQHYFHISNKSLVKLITDMIATIPLTQAVLLTPVGLYLDNHLGSVLTHPTTIFK